MSVVRCMNVQGALVVQSRCARCTQFVYGQRRTWFGMDEPMSESYRDVISLEPGKRSGQPTIRGLRITVYDVLSYLAAGMTHKEILDDFPYLTEDDIRACLSYAADRVHHALVAHV